MNLFLYKPSAMWPIFTIAWSQTSLLLGYAS